MDQVSYQTGRVLMNVEQGEKYLDSLNNEIIKKSKRINKIPFKFIQNYLWLRLNKLLEKRNEHFKVLRQATREKYPERFS